MTRHYSLDREPFDPVYQGSGEQACRIVGHDWSPWCGCGVPPEHDELRSCGVCGVEEWRPVSRREDTTP